MTGSGDVIAACQVVSTRSDYRSAQTHQMQHGAGQDAIDREVYSAAHEVQSVKPKVPVQGFLYPTHVRRGRQANVKLRLETRVPLLKHLLELWPMMHDHYQVMVAMKIGSKVVAVEHWRTAVFWIVKLEVSRQIP